MKKTFSKKNILYVIPYFVPAWSYGGTVKVSFDFAKELIKLGHNVTIATTDVLDAKFRSEKTRERIAGIEVMRFKNISNVFAKRFNFYTPIGFYKWLKKNIGNYDIVHIHEIFTYQSIITSIICHKLHKPYLIQPHGSLFKVARESRFNYIKKSLIRRFASLFYSSGAIIVLNETEKQGIENVYPKINSKIKIIPNGIDLGEFKEIKRIDLHKNYNIPKENKIIVFIGRIKYVKGLDISLQVLATIKKELKFTFLIIGPDEGERYNLEKQAEKLKIRDRIIFTGLISGVKKLETLKSADLSLLNSRSEGLPTTLLESAALGLPIVCSRESNFLEVKKFKAGFIVNDKQQTAQKIMLILEDPKLQRQLSQNSLKLADSFDIKKCTQTLNKIYESSL